jgi:hypothetical protein
MKTTSAHTPTPWKLISGPFGTGHHFGNDEQPIGKTKTIADAAFIVRAVNSHEELLKLVKDLNYAFYAIGTSKAMKEVMARSKEIIAKTEGRE